MEINLETLHRFVRDYARGDITLVDSTGTTRKLSDGQPDVWELAKTANQFWYGGTSYPRDAFSKLMENQMKAVHSPDHN
jgi:hypothetical protein